MRAREVPDLSERGARTSGGGPLRRGRAYTRGAMAGLRGEERARVEGAQAGSLPDLELLFREHWPRVYRAAYLVVHDAAAAEDIAQEAFLAAVRTLDRFDRRRPFGPWLHRIVINRAIDWARARALRAEVGDGPLAAVADDNPGPGSFSPPIVAALRELSPDHRAVIVLRHLLEYTPGEIAELLGVPRGTVNSRLRRGLDELADLLEGTR
jgi:RNA polymerase sigma-70 factor, ECF subfamily